MRYKLLVASGMVAAALIGAAPAYAVPVTGGAECGNTDTTDGPLANTSPGNAATSPGSVFNEPGVNSANGGKGNQAYNNAGAPSQYDRACAEVTASGSGTPIVATTPIDPKTGAPTADGQFVNNSRASRDAIGVSHTGKGANK
jgi:hypothetical protein